MKRVVIESPYAGNVELNLRYLRACMRDCVKRGESPYASHGLLTQDGVLDDNDPDERALGIEAGFAWRDVADKTVVYTDLGVSGGMRAGIADAESKGRPVEERTLKGWSEAERIRRSTPHDFLGDGCDCALCGEGWCHYLHDEHREREEAKFFEETER